MFFKNYVSPDNKLENIDFKNPFTNETVDSINIEIRKPWFDGDKPVKANVWFRNKNTSGIQRFQGDNLVDVIKDMERFIGSL